MRRLSKWVAVVMVAVTAGLLGQGGADAGLELDLSETLDRSQPSVLGKTAECGPLNTALYLPSANGVVCVHDAVDGLPGPFDPAKASAAAIEPLEPLCYGNGVNGNRVHVLYAHIEGQPNNIGPVSVEIRKLYLPRMEAVFRRTSAAQGREIGVRFHAPGCQIAIDTVVVPAATAALKGDFARTAAVMDAVTAAGYDSLDRKYLVFADMASEGPLCGVAASVNGSVEGLLGLPPVAKLPYGLADNPTPANPGNINLSPVANSIAIAFKGVTSAAGPTGVVGSCWGGGSSGARTETHELLHTLGAVQVTAPNSNGFGHCFDGPDIMCYTEGGVKVINACPNSKGIEQLDCNSDDYFAMSPPVGSYLQTHWNTAMSTFLGPQPVDDIPVELPRL